MKHVMVDLETLSTKPTAAILSIGACLFDKDGIVDTFYRNVDQEYLAKSANRYWHIEDSTVAWWKTQTEARKELEGNQLPIEDCFESFVQWLPSDPYCIWSNGADFDLPILTHALRWLDRGVPWKFVNTRCYRTIKNMLPLAQFERTGIAHRADADAVSQAVHLIRIADAFRRMTSVDLLLPKEGIQNAFDNYRFVDRS